MSGGWIHSFAVTDTQTHKDGFTIYKITSIVFPRAIPQALTCITVWKRFHDIKRLHREISRRKKNLKISGEMPEPTDSTYFKRFDSDIIERRKEFIITFLDFIAQHPALYKCHVFFQFFSDTSSPNDSPLHKLHMEKNNKVLIHLDENDSSKENENKINVNLVEISVNTTEESPKKQQKQEQQQQQEQDTQIEKENVDVSLPITTADADLQSQSISDKKPTKDYTRFLTPMASIETEDSDYIYEAALEFSRAVQAEVDLEYSEAHMRYKRGVEVLLNGSKDDTNDERRSIAKTKIKKYLARADDIFQKFLCGDDEMDGDNKSSNKLKVQLSVEGETIEDIHSSYYIERPLNHLAKYKVIKVLGGNVIQVQCVTDRHRPTYIIKGIEKPASSAQTQTIFLPQHIPYMVDLLGFFQSEYKIYLLIRYAEAGRLLEYMKNYELKAEKHSNLEEIFSTLDVSNVSQQEIETPDEKTEHNEFVRSSQRLLNAVSCTLNEVKNQKEMDTTIPKNNATAFIKLNKLPEASIKQWACELFIAIEGLHEKGVTLIDLHINNLLLGDKGQLLLTYFYQNQALNEEPKGFFGRREHCVAPERPLTFKSDWWSYGVILYQLLLGISFKTLHPGRIEIYGCVQYPDNIELSDCGRDLIDNLIVQKPEERFDAEQICGHEFFKGTNWDEIKKNGLNSTAKAS